MSRIGKKPIEIPAGVDVQLDGTLITVKGPKGTLSRNLHPNITVEKDGNGIGYRAELKGKDLILKVGYSHDVIVSAPEGITIEVPAPNKIVISGPDKQQVGQFAANVREKRPPEPYKGKGIKYADEHIRRKEGKAGKGGK